MNPNSAQAAVLSISKVCKRLDISEGTTRRLIETGVLKAHRIRHQWRIFESDLQDYLAAQSNRQPAVRSGEAA